MQSYFVKSLIFHEHRKEKLRHVLSHGFASRFHDSVMVSHWQSENRSTSGVNFPPKKVLLKCSTQCWQYKYSLFYQQCCYCQYFSLKLNPQKKRNFLLSQRWSLHWELSLDCSCSSSVVSSVISEKGRETAAKRLYSIDNLQHTVPLLHFQPGFQPISAVQLACYVRLCWLVWPAFICCYGLNIALLSDSSSFSSIREEDDPNARLTYV